VTSRRPGNRHFSFRGVDKAVTHGVIHPNKAAREKSAAALELNRLLRATAET